MGEKGNFGIGPSITQEVMKSHAGRDDVSSDENGARFSLIFRC